MTRDRRSRNRSAVGQPGHRIGDFAFRDIRLRTGHPHRCAGRIGDHQPAREHPAEHAVLVLHPRLDFEMRRARRRDDHRRVCCTFARSASWTRSNHSLGFVADLVFGVAEHRLPARRQVNRCSPAGSSPTARRWRPAPPAHSVLRWPAAPVRSGGARCASARAPAPPGNRPAWSDSRWRPAPAP